MIRSFFDPKMVAILEAAIHRRPLTRFSVDDIRDAIESVSQTRLQLASMAEERAYMQAHLDKLGADFSAAIAKTVNAPEFKAKYGPKPKRAKKARKGARS